MEEQLQAMSDAEASHPDPVTNELLPTLAAAKLVSTKSMLQTLYGSSRACTCVNRRVETVLLNLMP